PRRRRRPGGRLRRRPVTAGDRPDLAAPSGAGAADPAPGPGPAGRPGVAAFDFDGTLARRDTLVPFLRRVRGSTRVAVAVARAAARTRDRDALKVAAIGHLFQGVAAADLERWGRAYAATLPPLLRPEMVARVRWHQRAGHAVVIVSASLGAYLRPLAERLGLDAAPLPPRLRPEMVARVRWHQRAGHAVVIVSASLGAYLRPLAERLGLDAALGVELAADASGLLTGEVVGDLNNRGPEKVARLR